MVQNLNKSKKNSIVRIFSLFFVLPAIQLLDPQLDDPLFRMLGGELQHLAQMIERLGFTLELPHIQLRYGQMGFRVVRLLL